MHAIGATGMVWMFSKWNIPQVGHFGSIFGFGVICFVWNMGRTLARIPRWTPVAFGIASAVGWLLITMLAGLYVACVKCWPWLSPFAPLPQMHTHAHLGVLGIFIILIVATSYRLVPMFTISRVQNARRAGWSIAMVNAGVASVAVSILFQSPWKLAAALLAVAGLALFGLELRAILGARTRPELDWGMRQFLTGITLLAPLAILSLVLCWPGLPMMPRLENVYAVLGVFGVLLCSLLGMLYKILPFFIWFNRYSGEVGRRSVPQISDLYSPRLQAAGYWLHLGGLLLLTTAAALPNRPIATAGSALLAVAVLTFGINAARILSHLGCRKTEAVVLGQTEN
jgi:hypothetical protein